MPIETEIGSRDHLRCEDDLAGVLREVLDNVENDLNSRDRVSLNFIVPRELFGSQRRDDRERLFHSVPQTLRKLSRREASASVKFGVAIAPVRSVAQRRNN